MNVSSKVLVGIALATLSACGNGAGTVPPVDAAGGAGTSASGSAGTGAAGSSASGSAGTATAGSGAAGAQASDGGVAGAAGTSKADGAAGTTTPTTTDGPAPSGPTTWPMFGHDFSNTRATGDTSIGAAQLATLRVAQRMAGAGVSSTPALVDGLLYYADYSGTLKAVNAQTGASVWSKQLQPGMLTPSPFVSADSVYIAGDGSTVYAVNRSTGAVRWSTKIESTPSNRIWSSPIVVGDTLLIGAGSYQVFIPATPTFRGSIVGLDVTTGAVKWRLPVCPEAECGGGVSVWSSVAVDPALKLAYIGTGQAYYAPAGPYSDSVIAFNYETGARVWHHQITANDLYTINGGSLDRDVGAAPNLFEANIGGTVRKLVGVGDKGGHYTAIDRETGVRVWQRVTDARTPPGSPIGGIMGAPAVANGRIYLTNNTSTMGTGRFDARPATCTAFALEAATGAVAWSTNLPAGSFSGNTVVNGLMYFVTYDGTLRALDASTGALLKSIALGTAAGGYVGEPTNGFPNGSTSGPIVADGRIYAGYGWTWGATITGGLAILDLGGN